MSNEIRIFENENFGDIRAMNIDGEPWFVGKDIATALGYAKAKNAISMHVDKEDKQLLKGPDLGPLKTSNYGVNFINESGLYSLILSSKLPSAKQFKRWVTSEVLPTLRKTGSYSIMEKPDSYMIDDPVERAERWIEEYQEKRQLEQKIEADAPLVDFANQVSVADEAIDFGAMAKILRDNDIKIGRNKLFELARRFGWLRKNNEPYQRYIEQGIFKTVEYLWGDKPRIKTLITGKGQLYITEKIIKFYKEKDE